MPTAFDLDAFSRGSDTIARLVRAEDLFGLLRRRVTVPTGCTALVWGSGGAPRVVGSGEAIEADGVREILFVRSAPIELSVRVDPAASRDGFAFRAEVAAAVHVVPERQDLASFRNAVLGSKGSADAARLTQVCDECLSAATLEFAKSRDAAALADPTTWEAFDAELAARFKPLGFSTGLALGRDPRVTFVSEAFAESQRNRQSARLRQERLEADAQLRSASVQARKAGLAELETLVEKARALAERAGGAGIGDLIKSFDPTQRGEFYHGLLASAKTARPTRAILVVAGDELLEFDPSEMKQPRRRVSLSSPLGGLRSVRAATIGGEQAILVGAGRGVHRVAVEGGLAASYACPTEGAPRGGFNAAVIIGDSLAATHSELGLVRWSIQSPGTAECCLADLTAGVKTVRDIQIDAAGRAWLSIDDKVVQWRPDEPTATRVLRMPGAVTALLVCDEGIFAGLSDGRIVRRPHAEVDELEIVRGPGGGAVQALGRVAGGGVPRLVVAAGAAQVDLLVIGDASRAEYRAPLPIKWAVAGEDCLVGVGEGRDQLHIWRPGEPESPAATVSIGRLCGRSIQDVALL